jgi:hypothetical protein
MVILTSFKRRIIMCKKLIYFVSFVLVLGLVGNVMAQIDPASVETGHVYLFDNVSGTDVPDDSANDNTGIIVGDPTVVEGLSGQALQFDGVDDGVDIPDSDFINVNGGPFPNRTVTAVFNCADVTKQEKQTVFEEGGLTRGLTIYVFDGQVYVGGWNKAEYQWNPGSWLSAPINSGQWYTVSLVIRGGIEAQEGDRFEMWMDGNFIASAVGGHIHNHSNDNAIGYTKQNNVFHDGDASGDGWFFEGIIDEVWILNEAVGKVPVALGPTPADGAVVSSTPVDLFWRPAGVAVEQDLYFSENFDDVNTSAVSAFLALGQTAAGVDAPITVVDLIAETTYYWRIDAVDDANPDSPWKGNIWSFTIATQKATEPSPTEGAMFVNPATTLSWEPGLNAQSHTVYISDNFDDANNATGGTAQTELTFTPEAPLETGKIYYWRVDEYDGANTHKGDIWSFETPPFVEISDPNLVGWWKLDGEYLDLGYVLDYSGHNYHATLRGDPQLIEGHDGGAMDFDGDDDYINVDGFKGILADADGVQQPFTVTAWVKSTDDGDRTIISWGTSTSRIRVDFRLFSGRLRVEHGAGNRQGDTNLIDGEWHHVALTMIEGATISHPDVILWLDGSDDTRAGTDPDAFAITARDDVSIGRRAHNNSRHFLGSIDDVRLYDKVLTDAEIKILGGFLESSNPDPADGAKIVDSLAIMTWSPGPLAAEFDVYFGTNPEPGAGELVGRVADATHIVTDLAKGQTYYWRVDDVEADGTTIHTGKVWSFFIPPEGAYNTSPADGSEVTDLDADLNWDVDWDPVLTVVHFGTDADQVANAPEGFGPPLLEPGFDPGPLEPGMTYYWRVDVFYGTWVISPVMSFTTPAPKAVVFDFETDAQGWGGLKDGTAPTVSAEVHSAGGSQSLCVTIDEAAHDQQEGGWASPRVFTVDEAAGGLNTLSFWYRVDSPGFEGGNFVLHWISSTEAWSGGGWYGNGLWGVVVADGQWHQQTADLSILGEAAGGWEGTWGDQAAWEFRDDLLYSFEIAVSPTDNTNGSNIYIDDIVFSE